MAKGQTLPAAQRGIAFSTVSALMVSVLIMVVGAGYHKERTQYYFSITHLGPFIHSIIGTGGVVIFSVGASMSFILAMTGLLYESTAPGVTAAVACFDI